MADVFGSGFEEAKYAATEAMKNLIQSCVDEDLIKQGVDRVRSNSELYNRKSAPSIIEKICATIGSLLDNRYRSEWDVAFQVVSVIFEKLGKSKILVYSSYSAIYHFFLPVALSCLYIFSLQILVDCLYIL